MSNGAILRRYHEELTDRTFIQVNKIAGVTEQGQKVGFGRADDFDGQNDGGRGETPYTLVGKPWHEEPYFRANTIIGINQEEMHIAHDGIEVPTPLSDIFSGMTPHFTDTVNTTYEVVSYWEAELVTGNRLVHMRIDDISES